jgi:hypothetical protein
MNQRAARSAGASAIVFVILIVITVLSGGKPPAADASPEKITTYFADHRTAILVGTLLGLFATPLALWFFANIRDAFRGDATANALGVAALLGIAVTGAMAMAGGAVMASVVYLKDATASIDKNTIRLMYQVQALLFASTAPGLALAMGSTAAAARRTRTLPVVVVWFGALGAVANIVAMFSVLSAKSAGIGFVGLIGFLLFLLVTGIALITGASRSS